ncbi:MAG: PLP-dependent aminotransferase family protein [Actinomycetota bacterium]
MTDSTETPTPPRFDPLIGRTHLLPAPTNLDAEPLRYRFVGGNNDGESVPHAALAEAAAVAVNRLGPALATYNLGGSALGYEPLREFVAEALTTRASTPTDAGDVLITSGSLQALDLVNEALVQPGETVLVEQATYGGMLSRLNRAGIRWRGVALDGQGIVVDDLERVLTELAAEGIRPRYLYTIPTVQNPTGSVLPLERRLAILDVARRNRLAIFEDDCYADLQWDGDRPPTFRALDDGGGQVIYCGSFSKSVAPALRVGYIVADRPMLAQLVALKTDAGTGALEQLTLAEFAPAHFNAHVENLKARLRHKAGVMVDAVRTEFGSSVEIEPPLGGIYVWLTFDDGVDTDALAAPAAAAGVEFNPGSGWSADADDGRRRLRLCFGDQSDEDIRTGVATLARIAREMTAG